MQTGAGKGLNLVFLLFFPIFIVYKPHRKDDHEKYAQGNRSHIQRSWIPSRKGIFYSRLFSQFIE